MGRAATLVEFIGSLMILFVGFYTLYAGYLDSTGGSMIKLPVGAALIFSGGLAMSTVTRSHLHHVRRLRGDLPQKNRFG